MTIPSTPPSKSQNTIPEQTGMTIESLQILTRLDAAISREALRIISNYLHQSTESRSSPTRLKNLMSLKLSLIKMKPTGLVARIEAFFTRFSNWWSYGKWATNADIAKDLYKELENRKVTKYTHEGLDLTNESAVKETPSSAKEISTKETPTPPQAGRSTTPPLSEKALMPSSIPSASSPSSAQEAERSTIPSPAEPLTPFSIASALKNKPTTSTVSTAPILPIKTDTKATNEPALDVLEKQYYVQRNKSIRIFGEHTPFYIMLLWQLSVSRTAKADSLPMKSWEEQPPSRPSSPPGTTVYEASLAEETRYKIGNNFMIVFGEKFTITFEKSTKIPGEVTVKFTGITIRGEVPLFGSFDIALNSIKITAADNDKDKKMSEVGSFSLKVERATGQMSDPIKWFILAWEKSKKSSEPKQSEPERQLKEFDIPTITLSEKDCAFACVFFPNILRQKIKVDLDNIILQGVRDALKEGIFSKGYENLKIKAHNRIVTLSGMVDTNEDLKNIQERVSSVPDVKGIIIEVPRTKKQKK